MDALCQSQAVEKIESSEGSFYTFLDLLDAKPSPFRVDRCVYSRETLENAEYGVITNAVREQMYSELEQLSQTQNWAAQAINEHELLYSINHLPSPVRRSQVAGHSRLPFKQAEQHLQHLIEQRSVQFDRQTHKFEQSTAALSPACLSKKCAFIRQFPAALKEERELNMIRLLKNILFVFLGCICLAVTARVNPIIIILLGFAISSLICIHHLKPQTVVAHSLNSLMSDNRFQFSQPQTPPAGSSNFKTPLILFLIALIGSAVFFLVTFRVQRVSGTEVGIKVNNVTGDISVIAESGTNIYNGLLNSFHLLDMTVQRLEMVAQPNRGERNERDDLRVKTVDGSDVFLDLTINYQLRRDMVEAVVLTSGLGDVYKFKWVRDYSRSICRSVFGEMTTEEFYDASVRNTKAQKAMEELNSSLPYGIEISSVIAEKFSFHKEYEERIRAKKLADQEVEEQVSKANAARQNQIFREVEATKKKEVVIATYEGEMQKLIVEATANAERDIRQAEAYVIDTQLGADADFYSREKNAQAILVKAQTEGEALKALARAHEGPGGYNLVKTRLRSPIGPSQTQRAALYHREHNRAAQLSRRSSRHEAKQGTQHFKIDALCSL